MLAGPQWLLNANLHRMGDHLTKGLQWIVYQKEENRTHVFYAPSSQCVVFIKWNIELEAKSIGTWHSMLQNGSHLTQPGSQRTPPTLYTEFYMLYQRGRLA